jgi:hypothetical protein
MRSFYKLSLRLRSLFRNNRVEQELSEEIRFHLKNSVRRKSQEG